MDENILELKDITVEFGGIRALNDISLNVRKGEIFGLLGPNGAGKTSLLNCIMGLSKMKKGSVSLAGKDLSKVSAHKRTLMGISRSSQGLSLCDSLSVMENLLLRAWLEMKSPFLIRSIFSEKYKIEIDRKFRKKLRAILTRLDQFRAKVEGDTPLFLLKKIEGRSGFADTADIVNTVAGSLPFASKKRIEFARTLAGNPLILLLDEPTAGLQQIEILELGNYLVELRDKANISILVVEHNMKFIKSICDRVAVLNFGEKVFEGSPGDAMEDSKVKEVYLGSYSKEEGEGGERALLKSAEPVLVVKNLTLRYGPIEALKEVSLELNQGEIVSVVGLNGSGKSSLLKSLSGIEEPLAGSVHLKGQPLVFGKPEVSYGRGVRMLPETARIFSDLTVLENLKAVIKRRRGQKNWRDFLKRYFPVLLEKLALKGGDLSGGQRQMLALAQAFLSEPQILLLDEPSLGLAPKIVSELFMLTRQLNRDEGTSILIVEQNVFETLRISDRAYVIESGRIVKSGSGAELLSDEGLSAYYFGETT
jgi:branched-chain amino acid transport system ATP-binding protein